MAPHASVFTIKENGPTHSSGMEANLPAGVDTFPYSLASGPVERRAWEWTWQWPDLLTQCEGEGDGWAVWLSQGAFGIPGFCLECFSGVVLRDSRDRRSAGRA